MSLKITKGGKLIETRWVYDESIRKGSYIDYDKTSCPEKYLFDPCDLDKNVTLKDIFLLIHMNEVIETVIGNWCKEIVNEGFGGDVNIPLREYKNEYNPKGIEYLELSKYINIMDGQEESIQTIFDGQGWELREDIYEQDWLMYKKGSRIGWGLDFTPAYDLINIPVKLNTNLRVYSFKKRKKEVVYKNQEFTLGEVIYTIIWELSFHGTPEDRDEASKNMKKAVDQIKKEL